MRTYLDENLEEEKVRSLAQELEKSLKLKPDKALVIARKKLAYDVEKEKPTFKPAEYFGPKPSQNTLLDNIMKGIPIFDNMDWHVHGEMVSPKAGPEMLSAAKRAMSDEVLPPRPTIPEVELKPPYSVNTFLDSILAGDSKEVTELKAPTLFELQKEAGIYDRTVPEKPAVQGKTRPQFITTPKDVRGSENVAALDWLTEMGIRGAKDLWNKGVASVLHGLGGADVSPQEISAVEFQKARMDKRKKAGGRKFTETLLDDELEDIKQQLTLKPEARDSDDLKKLKIVFPKEGDKNPFVVDVQPPQRDEAGKLTAQGMAEFIQGTGISVLSFVSQIAILKRMFPQAPPTVIWEARNLATGGQPGAGAGMRGGLGLIEAIPSVSTLGKGLKVGAGGGLYGGITWAQGGSREEIVANTLIGMGFQGLALRKKAQMLKQVRKELNQGAYNQTQQNIQKAQNAIKAEYRKNLDSGMKPAEATANYKRALTAASKYHSGQLERQQGDITKLMDLMERSVHHGEINEVLKMTPQELHRWVAQKGVTPKAAKVIAKIRTVTKKGQEELAKKGYPKEIKSREARIVPVSKAARKAGAVAKATSDKSVVVRDAEGRQIGVFPEGTELTNLPAGAKVTVEPIDTVGPMVPPVPVAKRKEVTTEKAPVTAEKRNQAIGYVQGVLSSEKYAELDEKERLKIGVDMLAKYGVKVTPEELATQKITPEKRSQAIDYVKGVLSKDEYKDLSEAEREQIGKDMLAKYGVTPERGELTQPPVTKHTPEEIEARVLRQTKVATPGIGRTAGSYATTGYDSQVTEVMDHKTGKTFWTREALRPPGGWGKVSSGVRQGLKEGRKPPNNWPQVLELAIDNEAEGDFERISELIKNKDKLDRNVVRNRNWTPTAAKEALKGIDLEIFKIIPQEKLTRIKEVEAEAALEGIFDDLTPEEAEREIDALKRGILLEKEPEVPIKPEGKKPAKPPAEGEVKEPRKVPIPKEIQEEIARLKKQLVAEDILPEFKKQIEDQLALFERRFQYPERVVVESKEIAVPVEGKKPAQVEIKKSDIVSTADPALNAKGYASYTQNPNVFYQTPEGDFVTVGSALQKEKVSLTKLWNRLGTHVFVIQEADSIMADKGYNLIDREGYVESALEDFRKQKAEQAKQLGIAAPKAEIGAEAKQKPLLDKYGFKVDKSGAIVAYHGTDRAIEGKFIADPQMGAFFSSTAEDAAEYGKEAIKREQGQESDLHVYEVRIRPKSLGEVQYDKEGNAFLPEGDYDAYITNQAEGDLEVIDSDIVEVIEVKRPALPPAVPKEKEIKPDEKEETIIEPATSLEMEPKKAGEPVLEKPRGKPTGQLDPTKEKDAAEITRLHANWVEWDKYRPVWEGIYDTISGEVEYTPEQVDTAYRTVQKPVPSPMADTKLFAMPGKENELEAIGKKMTKLSKLARKKVGRKGLPKPKNLPRPVKTKEDHIKAVFKAASKEESRYAITGVLVEGDTIVATDNRRLFGAKGKWGKDGLYTNTVSLKKGLLGKADKKGKFPNWQDILPDISGQQPVLVEDLITVWKRARQAESMTTEESRGIVILVNKDGSLGFAGAGPEAGHAEINIQPGGRILGAVKPDFFLDMVAFHATRGDTSFEFYFPDFRRAMYSKSLDGKTFTLTMPINVGDEGPMSEAIAKATAEGKPGESKKKGEPQTEIEARGTAGFIQIKGEKKPSVKVSAIVKEDMSTGSKKADSFLRRTKGFTSTGEPGILRKTFGRVVETLRGFHYLPQIPKTEPYGDIREHFRHTEEISHLAWDAATEKMRWALKPLEGVKWELRKRFQALEMKIVADDLAEDVENDLRLPPDLSKEDIRTMQLKADSLYDKYPSVREAYDRIRQVNIEVGDMLVQEGMLEEDKVKDFYFPHRVIKYLRNEDGFFGIPTRKPTEYKPSYLKERKGGYDYSTDIMERLVEHWAQVQRDIAYRQFLEKVLKQEQANWFRKEYPEWREWTKDDEGNRVRNLVPEGYKEVTVLPGRYYYSVYGVTEDMAKAIINQNLNSIEEIFDTKTATQIRRVLALGRKRSYIVREPIAKQLTDMPTMPISRNPAYMAVKGFNTFVKMQILFNPLYTVPFHVQNFIGDASKVFVALPSALKGKYLANYWKEIIAAHRGEKSKRFELAQKYGVIGSGWIGVDIARLNEIMPEIEKAEISGAAKTLTNKCKKYWNLTRKVGQGREDWLRYALFDRLMDLQKAGKAIIKYSIKDSPAAKGIADPDMKAAKVARDIAGDYSAIGKTGRILSDLLVPFYRWMHLNLPWWPRMLKEYAKKGQYGRLIYALLAAALPYIAAMLWNYSDEERRRFEKTLPPWKRWNFHINSLHGKKMYYVQLPLDDVLNFIGIPEDILDFQRYQRGMINGPELAKRIAINSAYEPGMSVINSIGGLAAVVRDAIGWQTFPDFKNYRITDWKQKGLNVGSDIFGSPGQLGKQLKREGISFDEDGNIVLGMRTKDTLNRAWMGIRPYSVDIEQTAAYKRGKVYKRTVRKKGQIRGAAHKGKKRLVDSLNIQLEGAK